ncbi:MAG: efflux transporter outer membrane subunit [Prevotella histicola]|jgi:efflux transporter, outer membrane factor lipoprotein, NodT family|uniref:Multidrug transporter n=1 Tax=Prevotella histicola JCM 15637 = DNF00424 TaxID=1236504 RepID=A0AAW3FG39_9BACT|nr:efflux transporter outer membrane subunit [Prevotella histicola]KGF26835.1 multidrug transporter [Prevotella histicola JCM 15637 = DNF00424]MBF1423678.1 efflux transporter outer membrane subunit [Prevotella histicola]MBS5897622.1 efflux transporter outer membrane subunit [Prevotella histicola]MBW4738873.1 efflux transporter outer membrane subunit [Prevotella histicola]MBW4747089.1 efflux transporter outer membrane subunit [Prevotella histicola]
MKKTNIIIIAFAALSLTGCKSLYGNYERPDIKTSGIVRDPVDDKAALAGSSDFGNLPWRSVFTDPQLQTLIEKALENNPDLLNAALNIDIAEQQLRASKLAFLPSVVFAPNGSISHFGTHTSSTQAYTLPITASWDVDLFGKLRSQKKAAQMALIQSRDYKVAVQTNLICNVANLYYTLLMLDRQKQIVDDMSGLTKNTWDMMKLQMEFGRARSTSVQSAEAAYYSVQTQGADIKRQIRETENTLSLLLGEPAQSIARGSLENQSLPANFSGGIGVQLLSNRADVHANEMALAQCFYNIQEARSRFYPALNISPTGAWTNSNGLVNPGKLLLSVVGSLTQPIFMRGQLKAGLRVAEDRYKQAYNTWQNSILKAGAEVSNALVAYNSADEKNKLQQQQIDVLKQNVDHTQMLYAQSSSSYLEVITAQQSLLNAEISQVQEQFTKLQAIVNLYNALGGGSK